MGLTQEFCARLSAIDYAALPSQVVAAGRRLFLDGLSVAVAGCDEEAVRLLAEHYRNYGARPEATALGLGFRTAAPWAAALNGAAMHVLDFEPMWSPATHALSTTLPAVLAMAEVRRSNGRDVLTALVKGIEAQSWLRYAGHASELTGERFHPPGVVGPIGSAVATGHIIGLDVEALTCAVGIAASRSGSLFANAGTMTKCTHCGHAAEAGLEAAVLAKRGFTSNRDVIDAPDGFAAAFLGEAFDPNLLSNVGDSFRIVEPGFALKMFPCQFGTHFAVTAGLELSSKIGAAGQVKRIRLTTPVMPYVNRAFPETGLLGKFSFQYAFSRALLDGRVTIDTFTAAKVADPQVLRVLRKVELIMDPAIPARFEAMRVEAEVWLDNGDLLRATCDAPRGSWRGAPVGDAEHLEKARDCLSRRLSDRAVDRCVDLAMQIDSLEADDVAELMAVLCASAGPRENPGYRDKPPARREAQLEYAPRAGERATSGEVDLDVAEV